MNQAIEKILKFNTEAGLLDIVWTPSKESTYAVEEALESFNIGKIARKIGYTFEDGALTAKDVSRYIMEPVSGDSVDKVDVLDKACDQVVFAIGTMFKLGLSVDDVYKALNIVMDKNLEKLQAVNVDSEGKLTKQVGFVGPEQQLQELLDTL